jgi:hypothetical protein
VGIVAVLLGIILMKIGPVGWRRVQLAYWQNRCMSYSAPADEVVLTIGKPSATPAVPKEWTNLYAMLSPPGMRSGGTLFLHERTSPSGNRRLVAVDAVDAMGVAPMDPSTTHVIISAPRVVRPGSLLRDPIESVALRINATLVRPADAVHAGQPDPNDPSHFTIRIASGSEEQILDGWLRDDDQVVIERRAATTAPVTRSLP